MKLLKIFFVFFACVWIFVTECFKECSALRPCSVRTRVIASQNEEEADRGMKCACLNGFYGKNCRFKAQDYGALKFDANWHPNGSAIVEWKTLEQRKNMLAGYRLVLRRVRYSEEGLGYSKWRKVTNVNVNLTTPSLKLLDTRVFNIPLSNTSSYEVNLVTLASSGKVTSISVYLDSPYLDLSGFDNTSDSNQWLEWGPWNRCQTNSSCGNGIQLRKRLCASEMCYGDDVESKPCQLNCPGRSFHAAGILENDKGPNCFHNGAIVGATGGSISTLVLVTFVFVLVRQWRIRHKLRIRRRRTSINQGNFPSTRNHPHLKHDSQQQHLATSSATAPRSLVSEPEATSSKNSPAHGSGFVAINMPGTGEDDGSIKKELSDSTVTVLPRSSSVVITIEENDCNGQLSAETAGRNAVTSPQSSRHLSPRHSPQASPRQSHQSSASAPVDSPGVTSSNNVMNEADTSQPALQSDIVEPEPSGVQNGSTHPSPRGSRSVILDIQETNIDDVITQETPLQESSSVTSPSASEGSSGTSSSSVEAFLAVLVTIGTGNHTPTEPP